MLHKAMSDKQRLAEARLLEAEERPAEALNAYERIVKDDPLNTAAIGRLLVLYRREHSYKEEFALLKASIAAYEAQQLEAQEQWRKQHQKAARLSLALARKLHAGAGELPILEGAAAVGEAGAGRKGGKSLAGRAGGTRKSGKTAEPGTTAEPGKTAKSGKTSESGKMAKLVRTADPAKTAKLGRTAESGKTSEPGKTVKFWRTADPAETAEPGTPGKSERPARTSDRAAPSRDVSMKRLIFDDRVIAAWRKRKELVKKRLKG